jgi:peroxiredoxin Q/BCP
MSLMTVRRYAAVVGLGVGLSLSVAAKAADLKVGDKAPPFTLQGSDGKTYSLGQFEGKKAVVLAWYPKADTPGCTAECKSFRDKGSDLRSLNVAYFTISVDTPDANRKFAEKYQFDYPTLSDPDKSVAKAYGVLNEQRGMANRWTFYIDKNGVIKEIDKKINTANAAPDVAAKVKSLGLAGG